MSFRRIITLGASSTVAVLMLIPLATALLLQVAPHNTTASTTMAPVNVYTYVDVKIVKTFQYVEPLFKPLRSDEFSKLCSLDGEGEFSYVVTLSFSKNLGGDYITICRESDYRQVLFVVHSAGGVVKWRTVKTLEFVGEYSTPVQEIGTTGSGNTSGRIKAYAYYKVYSVDVQDVLQKASPRTATHVSSSSESEAVVPTAIMYIYDLTYVIVYSFGSLGSYNVYLKQLVWVLDTGWSRQIIWAQEDGSYGERTGAMAFLFSQCFFDAWVNYWDYSSSVHAEWGIAENTFPLTTRCYGRPVFTFFVDGTMTANPGGPSCGLELGAGCYGWSP